MAYKRHRRNVQKEKIRTSKDIKWLKEEKERLRRQIDNVEQWLEKSKREYKKAKIREIEIEKIRPQTKEALDKWIITRGVKPGFFQSKIFPQNLKQWEYQNERLHEKWSDLQCRLVDLEREQPHIGRLERDIKYYPIGIEDNLQKIKQIEERIETVRRLKIKEQEKRDLIAKAKGDARSAAQAVKSNLRKTSYCPYCLKEIDGEAHADHIIPLAAGGSSFETNMVYICASCNLSKGSLTLLEFCEKQEWDFMEVASRLRKLGKRV